MEQVTALVASDATTTNVYELKARWAKAGKLADVLIAQGATSTEAAALAVSDRAVTAAIAGVRRPSAVTWDMVVDLIAAVERGRRLGAAELLGSSA